VVPLRPITYFRHCRSELLAHVPATAAKVLDIGCGTGALGAQLRTRQPCEVWGVECDPDAANEARANLDRVVEAPIDAALAELPAGYFDTLIAADVLEHLTDPWATLRRLTAALRPGARVLLSLPNLQHHAILADLLRGRFTYTPEGILDMTHLRFFTRASALELAQRAGLEIEQVVPLYSGGRDRRAAQRGRPPASVPLPAGVPLTDVYASQFLVVARATAPAVDTSRLRVSIVMLTFNRVEVTQQAIASLRAASSQPYELIIVDNASTDATRDYLAQLPGDQARVILNQTNRGVAAGWNQGLREATGDCLMVLNNDVLVAGDWLGRMVRTAYQVPRAGLVSCRTNFAGGPQVLVPDYDDLRDFPLFARRYAAATDGSWFELPRLVGVALLWRREVWERIGEFDEGFTPANFEDDDYCVRVLAAGYRNLVANDVFIHHIGHASQAANDLDPDELLSASGQRFRSKWGEVAAPVSLSLWSSFEQHIAQLRPEQYALPGWALPEVAPRDLANQLARIGRRLTRRGWKTSARQFLRRSLRIAITGRGIWGWVETLLPQRVARHD
jgi:GT2 family glycosyltransferase/2-polyprenyl-3-methyl-5-hydroxy-6-metoxy-1,4-benzoquinol methylase